LRTRDELRLAHSIKDLELDLVRAMLAPGHPYATVILNQASAAIVRWLDARGQPAILFEVSPDRVDPIRTDGVIAEAQALDKDGGAMHLLLHVRGGLLREIEVYREDGNALIEFPAPSGLSALPL
jgi:uncharacterized protein DUF6984